MLINARPRYVSHGFETFVPIHRAESLHQRLVEMTNNDVNTWNFLIPVPSPDVGWDENLHDFNNENFALHPLYPGYYQNTPSIPQPQISNLSKASHYPTGQQSQCNTRDTASNSHPMHHDQPTGLTCLEKQSPMLANGYSDGYLEQRHGSFAEFLNTRHGSKQFASQNPNLSDLVPFTSALSGGTPSPYQEDVAMISDFNVEAASPSTTYSGYSSASAIVDPVSLAHFNVSRGQNASMKDLWWPANSRNGLPQYQESHDVFMLHDGLPRAQKQRLQQCPDPWTYGSVTSSDWSTLATATVPITISPKALTLNVPPAPHSASGSSQGLILSFSDSSSVSSSREDTPKSVPEILSAVESPASVRQDRQILADYLPRSRIAPVLPSKDFSSRKIAQKRSMKSKSEPQCRPKPSLPYHSKGVVNPTSSIKAELNPAKNLAPKKNEPKPSSAVSSSESSHASTTAQAQHHRDAKDDFLIRSKLAGMSYKDIRRHGNFAEAESTLRGRFRTLTKHKAARVRKPEWTDNDVGLLKKAVRKLSSGSEISKNKVPWKMVAEYIANNGGSYHFGNATCRKRWDDLSAKKQS